MRWPIALLLLLHLPLAAQVQNWDPTPIRSSGGVRFHDDLDFFLNGYSKDDIKAMRKQVSTWRMSFDKMMRATIKDIQAYSEGGNMKPGMHDFTLDEVRTGEPYHLAAHPGKLRAFMFGSLTNPPARAQLPYWEKLRARYDTAQVELFVVYGRELHPGDRKKFGAYPPPATLEQKRSYAAEFAKLTTLPVLLDGMDDKVFTAYGRVPNGAYVINAKGQLIFRGTWADNRKIEHILDTVLGMAPGDPGVMEDR
ncbi:MAG: hypothetical protein KDB93_06565 [Flavobacteriales bacterium]|nr:hypothetical protein [Flavobacteriales bacterium]